MKPAVLCKTTRTLAHIRHHSKYPIFHNFIMPKLTVYTYVPVVLLSHQN